MTTLRPQNKCKNCYYTWYPRGHNISLKCPNCGSNDIDTVGLGCLTQLVVYVIIGTLISAGIGMLDGENAKDFPKKYQAPKDFPKKQQAPKALVDKKKDPHVLMHKSYSSKEVEGCEVWANAYPLLAEKLKPSDRCFPLVRR